MKIIVNRTPVEVFEGARSRDALLRYCILRHLDRSLIERGTVYDTWGHEIGLDAPLREGQTIKIKIK